MWVWVARLADERRLEGVGGGADAHGEVDEREENENGSPGRNAAAGAVDVAWGAGDEASDGVGAAGEDSGRSGAGEAAAQGGGEPESGKDGDRKSVEKPRDPQAREPEDGLDAEARGLAERFGPERG